MRDELALQIEACRHASETIRQFWPVAEARAEVSGPVHDSVDIGARGLSSVVAPDVQIASMVEGGFDVTL